MSQEHDFISSAPGNASFKMTLLRNSRLGRSGTRLISEMTISSPPFLHFILSLGMCLVIRTPLFQEGPCQSRE
jgi:hypothetical protein